MQREGGQHSEGAKCRESGVKRQESRLERESGVGKLHHTEPTKVALINAVSMTMTKGKKRGEGVGGNGCQPGLHNGEYNARCARVCVCVRNFGNVCRSFLVNFFNRQSTQWAAGRGSPKGGVSWCVRAKGYKSLAGHSPLARHGTCARACNASEVICKQIKGVHVSPSLNFHSAWLRPRSACGYGCV